MNRQFAYTCKSPEIRPLGKGVMADYGGSLLIITCGHHLSAITANRGEPVLAHIMPDGTIALAGEKEVTRHKV